MRFVFVGQVRSDKGIRELIAASERLGPEASVDVFGPLGFDIDVTDLEGFDQFKYRGALPRDEVQKTLMSYDVLVLPTYYAGEGHPGVILEAYGAGLPVVTTRWRSIPEIVDDSCGVLVEPRSSDDLYRGMREIADDRERLRSLAAGARSRAATFDSRYWDTHFLNVCRELASRRG